MGIAVGFIFFVVKYLNNWIHSFQMQIKMYMSFNSRFTGGFPKGWIDNKSALVKVMAWSHASQFNNGLVH